MVLPKLFCLTALKREKCGYSSGKMLSGSMAIIDADPMKRKEYFSIDLKCLRSIGKKIPLRKETNHFSKGLRNIELKYPHLDDIDYKELTYLFLFNGIK